MTLGQKLKALLKDNGMTQEDLAEKLDVSRQAVGKWVNDKGIPEVGKLVQISSLFGVSIDYLLKGDCERKNVTKESAGQRGIYVSQEMLDGYLSYNRQCIRQIVGGISLLVLSNTFGSFGYDNMITAFFYWFTMISGLIIIIWHFFQTRQYQEMKTECLMFDDKVFEAFKKQREKRKKKYAVMIIAGVVILLTSSEIGHILMIYYGQEVCNVFEWIADALWLAIILWAGMSMHMESIVIKNTGCLPNSSRIRKYRWVYAALPATGIAVLIGMITNAWSPYAPILILFCCLLVTTCKLLIESREKNE